MLNGFPVFREKINFKELRNHICFWLVILITVGAKELQMPGSCQLGQYYEPSALSCMSCPANASMVTSADGKYILIIIQNRSNVDFKFV